MSQKTILIGLVSMMGTTLLAIATWWISEVNEDRKIVHALHYRSMYLDGVIPAAPLPPNPPKK